MEMSHHSWKIEKQQSHNQGDQTLDKHIAILAMSKEPILVGPGMNTVKFPSLDD
jgi:hypothetical protein